MLTSTSPWSAAPSLAGCVATPKTTASSASLSDKEVELRCHPDDQEAMAALVPEALRHCGYSKQGEPVSIRVAQSREIERGGCILDFEEGSVDAQPSAALDVVIAAIHETLGGDA